MKDKVIMEFISQVQHFLTYEQVKDARQVLENCLWNARITFDEVGFKPKEQKTNEEFLSLFLAAKRLEGCSENTLVIYGNTVELMFSCIDCHVTQISTAQLRVFLAEHKEKHGCSHVTIDNYRRYLTSFFKWLEEEGIILKSPIARIKKVKTPKKIKKVYSEQMIEQILEGCKSLRDKALICFLSSSGARVSEVVRLNIDDINFEERECIVFGKGAKERPVYFDSQTGAYLKDYLNSRDDDNPALFVTDRKPFKRLQKGGIEIVCREIGYRLELGRVHPHGFRRSMATRAISKGMPVEQVQTLLGHENLNTTMIYAQVQQENVKKSHRKYLGGDDDNPQTEVAKVQSQPGDETRQEEESGNAVLRFVYP